MAVEQSSLPHHPSKKTGLLLINLGTPEAPTPEAVRTYLAEFLSDPYVVDYPAWMWQPILNRIILKHRPACSARLYAKVWQEKGSPLLFYTEALAEKMADKRPEMAVAVGMRYAQPSIASALSALQGQGVTHLIVLPLFPQYSETTTGTALAQTREVLDAASFQQVSYINDYYDHPAYVQAVADSIRADWAQHGQPAKTLFSYHGIPARFVRRKGEPYLDQCHATSKLVAENLQLAEDAYVVAFQSRFGPEKWLTPYTDETLVALGNEKCPACKRFAPVLRRTAWKPWKRSLKKANCSMRKGAGKTSVMCRRSMMQMPMRKRCSRSWMMLYRQHEKGA